MAGNRVVNFHRPRSEEHLAGPHRAAGRTSASPTTGREKGAPLQTRWVCRATSWGRRSAGPRRQRPLPAHGTGARRASHPPEPSLATLAGGSRGGAARARPGGRRTWLGREGRALAPWQSPAMGHGSEAQTHAICVASGNARYSAACGRLVGRSAAERRANRSLCEGETDARRWAVPCHGAWQGTPRSVWRSGGLKPCPRCAAGRLDPASAPGGRKLLKLPFLERCHVACAQGEPLAISTLFYKAPMPVTLNPAWIVSSDRVNQLSLFG